MKTKKPSPSSPRRRFGALLAATTLLAGLHAGSAHAANQNLYFQGGPMKNLTIDLVFWGVGFTQQQMNDIRDYVVNFSKLVNGGFAPAGKELALHYYGVWGVLPGNTIVDTHAIPANILNHTAALSDSQSKQEIAAAKAGAFGASFDQFGNANPAGLPSGTERIAVLITQGIQPADGSGGTNLCGYHQYAGTPYAVVMTDCNSGFAGTLSHEVFEAMTDTTPWSGWVTNQGFAGLTHAEGADQCGDAPDAPFWTAKSGDNITGVSDFNLDPSFPGIPADTCQLFEPEQYAPIAATFTPTTNTAYFRQPSGALAKTVWTVSNNTHSTFGLGTPSSTVVAQGKPSAVFTSAFPDEFVFVRGSDNALWQFHNWGWTSLGGTIIGDPSAVVWNNGANINVFALASDNTLWTDGFSGGAWHGWAPLPSVAGLHFSGPPKAFAKTAASIDVFAVGQNGHLEWIPFNTTSGWQNLVDLGTVFGAPHHTPVAIASWATNRLDIFGTSETGVVHRGWNGSWASDYDTRSELGQSPSGSPATVSWGPNRLDAFVVDRQNHLLHDFYNGAWHSDSVFANDALGAPAVISRGSGLLDVYYRGLDGSLKHFNFNGSFWTNEGSVTSAGLIQ
jgi:hypothetical protein